MSRFEPNVAFPASLIGEPNRARILMALCAGEQRAGSLAQFVSASPQATSNHLARLVKGGLVCVRSDGRHRYYRLANPEVARVLELLAVLAPPLPARLHGRVDRTLHYARTCYDHLAGTLGVALADAMRREGFLSKPTGKDDQRHWRVTRRGIAWFADLGVDTSALRGPLTRIARCCLDRTEHRHHLAGPLGVAMLRCMVEHRWLERNAGTRAVRLTREGARMLKSSLGIDTDSLREPELPRPGIDAMSPD
ncbi:metalloregulator ArsR/SmtB family transcription factor [Burkholderia sp. FERM BP-3421]|uniref:ArsR/SmtB family transcription factor n=1 Tax=Burkholderia sp. FERM BP-3421 TaxID=1494466 RepID=UPI0023610B99|nr:metalloregulator ArsR/SmtB family transcription factor [Burkholderia sp. FERM BP-3421]WDD92802.1 metalloregulator ArsR/SmtB family transcription factor [Burkholderia sp. FERM BP-3421]